MSYDIKLLTKYGLCDNVIIYHWFKVVNSCMDFILKTIFNFIKFAIMSTIMVFICYSVDLKFATYLSSGPIVFLFTILIGIFAYKRKYFAFCKGDLKKNITGIIFIVVGLLWVRCISVFCIMFFYGLSVVYHM